jgi:VanZ family protein
MTSGGSRLAASVALVYTAGIVYASLQPFTGWRIPPAEVQRFLFAPWPRYVTADDVLLNVAAYFPLGLLLFAALRPRLHPAIAVLTATLGAAMLSLALEGAQMFLPARIASNVDLLTNISGAAAGAHAAWILALPLFSNNPLMALRRRAVRAGALGDCGLLVVALWILMQFHPAPLALGSGDLREALEIAPLFAHTPQTYLLAETGVVALTVIAVGLLVSLLLQPYQAPLPAIAAALLLALAAKSLAAVILARAASWLQWLTPGMALGTGIGIGLLALVLRAAPSARAFTAVFCVAATVLLVNAAPENPYLPAPGFMLRQQPAHLITFSHIVQTLSLVWPLVATTFLLAARRGAPGAQSLPAHA